MYTSFAAHAESPPDTADIDVPLDPDRITVQLSIGALGQPTAGQPGERSWEPRPREPQSSVGDRSFSFTWCHKG